MSLKLFSNGRNALAIVVWLGSSVLGAGLATGLAWPSQEAACPSESPGLWAPGSPEARGLGVAALEGDHVVIVDPDGKTRKAFVPPGGPGGLLRHISNAVELGTAYVDDRRGPDTVVIATPDHVFKVREDGEAMHPTWSPSGHVAWSVGGSLRVWSPSDGSVGTIPIPSEGTRAFSPVFMAPDEITAVVEEPVPGTNAEDDTLDNLWRYELDTQSWARLTSFEADAERWSVIRTPVLAPDGTLRFVRIQGLASATESPSYELWSLGEGAALEIRDLPSEMYLAAVSDAGLMWNTPGDAPGDWRLVLEGQDGTTSDVGCGRVAVDPVAEPDPDMLAEPGPGQPSGARRGLQEPPVPDASTQPPLAILVGDFNTLEAAEVVARQLSEQLEDPATVSVIDHRGHPTAIRPGVWAAVVQIPAGADPEAELARFRTLFPELAQMSWIVTP